MKRIRTIQGVVDELQPNRPGLRGDGALSALSGSFRSDFQQPLWREVPRRG